MSSRDELPPDDLTVIEGPATRFERSRYERHRDVLAVSSAVIVLAVLLKSPDGTGVTAGGWRLPELCLMKATTGHSCPGCGLTRSFVYLFEGRLADSLRMHPVGWLMAAAVVGQVPYRLCELRRLKRGELRDAPRWAVWFGRLLIAALIGTWVVRQLW